MSFVDFEAQADGLLNPDIQTKIRVRADDLEFVRLETAGNALVRLYFRSGSNAAVAFAGLAQAQAGYAKIIAGM